MAAPPDHPIAWLCHGGQRLGLAPSLGGGVAAWQLERSDASGSPPLDLWRPWDGRNPDRYTLASFAMVPWSNRISAGGFAHDGRFHPVRANRRDEPYPIHGDGWLQPWSLEQPAADTFEMTLESSHFDGDPYVYQSTQSFRLVEGGLDQSVHVTHLGDAPLPYGLGLHPWFPRSAGTRLQADVQGVWLSGADPLPTVHAAAFPATWDLRAGMDANGGLIDNAYTGWSGAASITWPEQQLQLEMRVPQVQRRAPMDPGYCLLYRPPAGPAFCFEPITHPIDAFHLPGRPGLRLLGRGETLSLQVQWRYRLLA